MILTFSKSVLIVIWWCWTAEFRRSKSRFRFTEIRLLRATIKGNYATTHFNRVGAALMIKSLVVCFHWGVALALCSDLVVNSGPVMAMRPRSVSFFMLCGRIVYHLFRSNDGRHHAKKIPETRNHPFELWYNWSTKCPLIPLAFPHYELSTPLLVSRVIHG